MLKVRRIITHVAYHNARRTDEGAEKLSILYPRVYRSFNGLPEEAPRPGECGSWSYTREMFVSEQGVRPDGNVEDEQLMLAAAEEAERRGEGNIRLFVVRKFSLQPPMEITWETIKRTTISEIRGQTINCLMSMEKSF